MRPRLPLLVPVNDKDTIYIYNPNDPSVEKVVSRQQASSKGLAYRERTGSSSHTDFIEGTCACESTVPARSNGPRNLQHILYTIIRLQALPCRQSSIRRVESVIHTSLAVKRVQAIEHSTRWIGNTRFPRCQTSTKLTEESKLKRLMASSVAGPFLCCTRKLISMAVFGSARFFP